MGQRRKAREVALQTLYLIDVTNLDMETAYHGVSQGEKLDKKNVAFCRSLIEGTLKDRDNLDKLIEKASKNWELKRMPALDRNIMRMGAFELLSDGDTPVSVVIDEAVELAKMYSTDDSGKFVNGILDKLQKKPDAGPK